LIFAVARIVIVTGFGPQENLMTPPAATADTTARDVQLLGLPVPMTRVGCEVSTARPRDRGVTVRVALPERLGLGLLRV
jgi:hypothetical protein